MRSPAALLLAALSTAALAGCGAGAGGQAAGTTLTVTDGFGAKVVLQRDAPESAGGDTVMRLLQRNAEVRTRYGGGFVQAIDGVEGGKDGGRPVDWFYFVNGVEAEVGAAERRLREGDRVWWDRRDWGEGQSAPAVVGSFPAPFTTGIDDRRLPVRVECAEAAGEACDVVVQRLVDLGVPAAKGGLARNLSPRTLRVLVGPWPALRGDRVLRQLERGPKVSGVFARPAEDGSAIALLDARGKVVRRGGPGTGLVAATKIGEEQPVWAVTGTDEAGLRAAADALAVETLRHRYAVAVEGDRATGVPLP